MAKRLDAVRVVVCGAGTVGTGCARLFLSLGVKAENLLVYDVKGLVHPDREDLHEYQRAFARKDPAQQLDEGLKGADVFLGASVGGVLSQEMVRSMGRFPVVLALSAPEPEIDYEAARASRKDVIVATSLDRHPNAVLDLLSFPYIFRGALDVQATRITPGMLVAAARALAELAREDVVEEVERAYGKERFTFGPEYLLPKPIDPRILVRESAAVARQAIEEGVARRPLENKAYQESLTVRLGTGRDTLRGMILSSRQRKLRVVFSEGTSETILRASSILMEEGIASPILLGREGEVRETIERLRLGLSGAQIVEPARSPRFESYVDEYFRMRRRRGVMRAAAAQRVRQTDTFAALMLHPYARKVRRATELAKEKAPAIATRPISSTVSCGRASQKPPTRPKPLENCQQPRPIGVISIDVRPSRLPRSRCTSDGGETRGESNLRSGRGVRREGGTAGHLLGAVVSVHSRAKTHQTVGAEVEVAQCAPTPRGGGGRSSARRRRESPRSLRWRRTDLRCPFAPRSSPPRRRDGAD